MIEMSAIIVAADVAAPVVEVGTQEAIRTLLEAMQSKNWAVVVAAAIWLLVSLIKIMWSRWAELEGVKPLLPWIAVAVGALTAIATGLAAGAQWTEIVAAATTAAGSGLMAVGLDKALFSKIFGMFSAKAKEEKAVKQEAVRLHRAGSLSLADLQKTSVSRADLPSIR